MPFISSLKKRFSSFYFQITVPVVLIIFLSIATLSFTYIRHLTALEHDHLLKFNRVLLQQVSSAVHNSFYTLNFSFVKNMIESEINHTDILWLVIINPQREVYLGRGTEIREDFLIAADISDIDFEQEKESFIDSSTLVMTTPILIGEEKWLLSLGSSLAEFEKKKANIISEGVLLGSIVILLGCCITLLLSRSFIRPLKEMSLRAEEIARGKFDVSLSPCRQNETSRLAETFNTMAAALQKASEQNKSYQENLQMRITERTRELQQASDLMDAILTTSNQGLLQVDNDQIIVRINARMAALLERTEEDIVGHLILEFVDDANRAILREQVEKRQRGESGVYEVEFLTARGGVAPCMVDVIPLYDENQIKSGAIGMVSDVRAYKIIEEQLKNARDKAVHASSAKSMFLANMSHEIRTPMNAIIGMSRLVLETDLTGKQRDYVSKVTISAESLLGIINDILDFSKIEAGRLDIESIDFSLQAMLKSINSLMIFKAEEKDLLFEITTAPDVPNFLQGDPLRLQQILVNLSNNSIKFTDQGGVHIEIEKIEIEKIEKDKIDSDDEDITLMFSVSDSGIGISTEQQKNLFQPFSQADVSTTRLFGGTGLGLAICKSLIAAMGGTIQLESKLNHGTRFYFSLTFAPGDRESVEQEQGEEKVDSSLLHGAKVLLVEDNTFNRELATILLTRNKIKVSQAVNGQEAVAMVQTEDFACILMDIQMPVMDGYTACRAIRSMGGYEELPIIALSANVMERDQAMSRDAGMNDHIGKPFNEQQILAAMVKWIEKANLKTSRGSTLSNSLNEQDELEELKELEELIKIDGLDATEGLKICVDDLELYQTMLQMFCDHQRTFEQNFLAALKDKDPQAATRTAHTLKGNGANIGAIDIQQAALALEEACKAGKGREIIEERLQDVVVKVDTLVDGLDRVLQK